MILLKDHKSKNEGWGKIIEICIIWASKTLMNSSVFISCLYGHQSIIACICINWYCKFGISRWGII